MREGLHRKFGFSKKERIFQPEEFRRVMKFGRKLFSNSFILFMRNNEKGVHRLGIVVKKETGTAVYRNRMKRYFREFFRRHKSQIPGAMDTVILVRNGCSIQRYGDAERELRKLLHLRKEE